VTAKQAPKGLGAPGRKFWRDIVAEYDLAGPHEAELLAQSCRELDLIARLDAELAGAPLTVMTRAHGEVSNRLLAEVAAHRRTLLSLLRELKLPAEPPAAGQPGTLRAVGSYDRRSHRRKAS